MWTFLEHLCCEPTPALVQLLIEVSELGRLQVFRNLGLHALLVSPSLLLHFLLQLLACLLVPLFLLGLLRFHFKLTRFVN